ELLVDVRERRARADRGGGAVELDVVEWAAVDHEGLRRSPAGPARVAVPSGPQRDRQAVGAGERQPGRDAPVGRDREPGARALAVVAGVLQQPDLVVRRVTGARERALHRPPQPGPRNLAAG